MCIAKLSSGFVTLRVGSVLSYATYRKWWRRGGVSTATSRVPTDTKSFATDRVLAAHRAAKCQAISQSTATDQRYRPDKKGPINGYDSEQYTASVFRTKSFNLEHTGIACVRHICTPPAHHMFRDLEQHKINPDFHWNWSHDYFKWIICPAQGQASMTFRYSRPSQQHAQHAWKPQDSSVS